MILDTNTQQPVRVQLLEEPYEGVLSLIITMETNFFKLCFDLLVLETGSCSRVFSGHLPEHGN